MKIEKRNNHKKKIVIGGMIVTTALVVGIFTTSYSKYRVTESIKLGDGIINYSSADFELVGMYLINEDKTETKIDTVPGTGYVLNEEKTKCTVNNIEIAASIEYKDNKLYFGDITAKGTKCTAYFKKKPQASETIIGSTTVKPGTDSFTGPATTAADSGFFSTQDDDGTTNYYRGIVNNNWVDFAGLKWRIIRTNGDGSIRMIYNGTSTATTGTTTQISTSAFNTNYKHNAYVGYMYGTTANDYASTHANTNPSTIKGVLDNWYKTNIVDKNYDKYVSKEAGFCGDRQVQSIGGSYTGNGGGTTTTSYAPWARLYSGSAWKTTQTPTYSCNTNDLYTVAASSKGNHALQYPVGLITSDEVVYAGGFGGTANQQFWLYTNQYYWTMSPVFYGSAVGAWGFYVNTNGDLGDTDVSNRATGPLGVRPVINLASDVKFTGSGTTSDPFRVASLSHDTFWQP